MFGLFYKTIQEEIDIDSIISLTVSGAQDPINDTVYEQVNGIYPKKGNELEFVKTKIIDEDRIDNIISKIDMITLLNYYTEGDQGVDGVSITDVYINGVRQNELSNNNATVWMLLAEHGEGPGIPINCLYFKTGEAPYGTYNKNTIKITYTFFDGEASNTIDFVELITSDPMYNQEFINIYGKSYNQLPNTINVTAQTN